MLNDVCVYMCVCVCVWGGGVCLIYVKDQRYYI